VHASLNITLGEVADVAPPVIGKLSATVSAAVVGSVTLIVGSVIAEVFEFAAGGRHPVAVGR